MSDYTRNFFLDPGIQVKEEPINENSLIINSSPSVPIPARRVLDITDYRDFGLDMENSQSPLYQDSVGSIQTPSDLHNTMWGNRVIISDEGETLKSEGLIRMDDDDDIFQVVDKSDLLQDPTLAQLNANDDTLLNDLNFDDLFVPDEDNRQLAAPFIQMTNSNHLNNINNNSLIISSMVTSSSCPQSGMLSYRDLDMSSSVPSSNFDFMNTRTTPVPAYSPNSQTSSSSSLLQTSPLHATSLQQKHSTLHELLMKRESSYNQSPERGMLGQSVPGGQITPSTSPSVMKISRQHNSRLSSSAPTHLGFEQLWQRREPRKHLLSTSSMAEAGSTSSLSTGGILSPDPQDFDDELDDEDDEESDADHHYVDVSSDNDTDDEEHNSKHSSSNKKERYFWQYNVQAKGPKGQRLVMKCKMEDPHVLHEITDPVFSPDCSVRGIKHSGKARKGDGNDLTPNARKLFNIGKELSKLTTIITDMTPVSELPFNVRPKSRKEKNKLASRACRLKKKAQHEANKIKLSGLEIEHRNILNGIQQCKELLLKKIQDHPPIENQDELTAHIENTSKLATRTKVAGLTTEYVNKILDRLKRGQPLNMSDDS